jgi:hypothetical protein
MLFDGLHARFQGEVEVRTDSQTARMPLLEATLNRRLDFAGPLTGAAENPAPAPLGLAQVLLDGKDQGVYIESRGLDEFGELIARDQISVKAAILDQVTGALRAQGPGWISTVRRGTPSSSAGGNGVPVASPPSNMPAAQSLSSIHVSFEREMVGDLNQRWIEFQQEVRTTYSPASDFGDVIVADPLGTLGERMVLMCSQTLRLTDTSFAQARSFELRAGGGTTVEGQSVFLDSPTVSYASDKETLMIEGDGRVLAKVFLKQPGRQGNLEGQRFWYNLRSGELKMDGVNLQFGLGAGIKLPIPGKQK